MAAECALGLVCEYGILSTYFLNAEKVAVACSYGDGRHIWDIPADDITKIFKVRGAPPCACLMFTSNQIL